MRAWELTVKGIINAGEAEAQQLEHRLASELHDVVAKAEYGAHHSVLGTPSFFGAVHTPQIAPAAPQQPAPAPVPAPAAPAAPFSFVPPTAPPAPAPTPAAPAAPAPADAMGAFLAGLTDEQRAAVLAFGQSMGLLPQ